MFHKHDIVQIIDETHHWFPCLLIVDEVKVWGIMGYLNIPQDNQGHVGITYIRIANDAIEKVGEALVVSD